MEYRLLGPLEVLDASGKKLHLGGAMQQSVLASLLLRADQTVALERIVDELWEEPPPTAARTVQAYVSRLRHELPHGAIESRPGGYAVVLDGHEFDLHAFERLAGQGHAALAIGECERAASLLREAIALWRGPALAGLTSETLRREAERLEEGRLSVIEDRIEADLGSARHGEIVPELNALVAEHPFRERLRAQLMRALYRSGRPGDALALYRRPGACSSTSSGWSRARAYVSSSRPSCAKMLNSRRPRSSDRWLEQSRWHRSRGRRSHMPLLARFGRP
jgi:DNA-binding SARP family transcriptional activator